MIDLNEFKAVQNSKGHLGLEMYAETKRTLFIRTSSGSLDSNLETFRTSPLINLNLRYKYESETGSGSVADSGYPVDFENKEGDVIIYATDDSGKTVSSTYFNLTQEKLASGISYKCYSLDGGSKWKETSKFTDKQIDAMLKKGMTLSIANKYDKKTKKPADDAVIYTFDTINKRPAAPKLKAEFKTYADPTGYTPGQWILADKSNTALSKDELAKYEIGISGADKKTVSAAGYRDIPIDTGIDFEIASGKTADSTIYFVRTKATEDTPASKAAKLTVKGQGKASKLKVDYKKEILKVKKGMIVFFGETLTEEASELKDVPKNYGDFSGKYIVVDEALAKSGIDISGYITDTRNTIMVWTAATEKKASTVAQVIKLAKRDSIKAEKLTVTGGKLKLDKKYEVYDEAKSKWGGLPKITQSCELKIRLKATAKGGAESDSSYAASNSGTLKITYDVIDAEKNKSGIISAEIIV